MAQHSALAWNKFGYLVVSLFGAIPAWHRCHAQQGKIDSFAPNLTFEEKALIRTFANLEPFLNPAQVAVVKRFQDFRTAALANGRGHLVEAEFDSVMGNPPAVQGQTPSTGNASVEPTPHLRVDPTGVIAGKRWAGQIVGDLQLRHQKAEEEDDNSRPLIFAALHFAKGVQKIAEDPANSKELSHVEIQEARAQFMSVIKSRILNSDFGRKVRAVAEDVFDGAAHVGLDVTNGDVLRALDAVQASLASAGYDSQMSLHLSTYGMWHSGKARGTP